MTGGKSRKGHVQVCFGTSTLNQYANDNQRNANAFEGTGLLDEGNSVGAGFLVFCVKQPYYCSLTCGMHPFVSSKCDLKQSCTLAVSFKDGILFGV